VQITFTGQREFDQDAFGRDPGGHPVAGFVAFASVSGDESRQPPPNGLDRHAKVPRHIRY
jgi:hypothetical protein